MSDTRYLDIIRVEAVGEREAAIVIHIISISDKRGSLGILLV